MYAIKRRRRRTHWLCAQSKEIKSKSSAAFDARDPRRVPCSLKYPEPPRRLSESSPPSLHHRLDLQFHHRHPLVLPPLPRRSRRRRFFGVLFDFARACRTRAWTRVKTDAILNSKLSDWIIARAARVWLPFFTIVGTFRLDVRIRCVRALK